MDLVFNKEEEAAVQRYADKHNISFGEALQKMIHAMTKGLMDMVKDDDDFEFEPSTKGFDDIEV